MNVLFSSNLNSQLADVDNFDIVVEHP